MSSRLLALLGVIAIAAIITAIAFVVATRPGPTVAPAATPTPQTQLTESQESCILAQIQTVDNENGNRGLAPVEAYRMCGIADLYPMGWNDLMRGDHD